VVDPSATVCVYCRAPTPNAERARAEERARLERASAERAEGERREQASAREKLEQTATRVLILSLVGMFICFIPVLQIVAIVSYLRARSLARQLSLDVPARATAGFWLSSAWLVLLPAFVIWAIVRDNNIEERVGARLVALDAQTKVTALQPALDWATACALAEMHALKHGHADEKGKNLVHFDCAGKLAGTPQRPMLERFSFRSDLNDKRFDVAVCFERGAKWYAKELNAGHACSQAAPPESSKPVR
jgi:hypothetical protein